jgi:VWFA-related protein
MKEIDRQSDRKRVQNRTAVPHRSGHKFLSLAFSLSLFLPLFLCLSVPVFAQSGRKPAATPQNPAEKADIRIETREVQLPVRAYNSVGKPVTDLAAKDVVIIEDGAARQTTSIKLEPANILLVLDLSNEIGTFKNGESDRNNIFSDEKDYEKIEPGDMIPRKSTPIITQPAPREFAYNLVDHLDETDRIAIIQYSDKVQLIQDWTDSHRQAREALESKFRVGIKSTFHDALMLAAKKLNECQTGRRVMVLVSDGLDSSSKTTRGKALEAILKTEASIFVVSWTELLRSEIRKALGWYGAHEARNTANYKRQGELAAFLNKLDGPETELKNLAELTGGEFYLPTRFKFFIRQPAEILEDIGAQYTLSYLTEREFVDTSFRSIQVLAARSGVTVKSRQRRYSGD